MLIFFISYDLKRDKEIYNFGFQNETGSFGFFHNQRPASKFYRIILFFLLDIFVGSTVRNRHTE